MEELKENMLEGLSGEFRNRIKELYDKVDFNSIKDQEKSSYFGVIRYISCLILSPDKEHRLYCMQKDNWRGIKPEDVFLMINVNEIMEKLENFYKDFLPISEKYFQHIDAHAEMMVIFSRNYVFGLIKECQKINK